MADVKYTVEVDTKGAQSALDSLKKAVGGLVAAMGVREIIQFGDAITGLKNKLATISKGAQDVENQFQAIAAIAMSARAPLAETADLYFRIARAADDLGISQQQAADITESVAKALTATGMSAQEAAGPLLQLGQALQSGRFQGDELRSILEGMPVVAQAMADELGVTVGKLRELGSQGKITGDVFVRAMEKAKGSIDAAFGKTLPTVSQALQNVKTAAAVAFNEFEKNTGTGKNLSAAIMIMAESIYNLGQNIDEVIGPIQTFLKVLGAIIAFTAVGKVIKLIQGAFAGLSAAATTVVTVFQNLRTLFSNLVGTFSAVSKSGGTMGTIFAMIKDVAAGLFANIGKLTAALAPLLAGIASFIGLDEFFDWFNNLDESTKQSGDSVSAFQQKLDDMKKALDDTQGSGRAAAESQQELANKAASAALSLAQVNEKYHDQIKANIENIQLEKELIGKSQEYIRTKQALADFNKTYSEEEKRLLSEIAKATLSANEEEKNSIPALEAALARLRETRSKDKEQLLSNLKTLDEAVAAHEVAYQEMENHLRAYQAQAANDEEMQQLRDQLTLVGKYGEELELATELLKVDQDTRKKINKLSEEEVKLRLDLVRAIDAQDEAEQRVIQSKIDGIQKLKAAEEQAGQERKDQIKANRDAEDKAAKDGFEGFKKSIEEQRQELKKYNIGESIGRNLSEAIDRFISTGKFKFKEFAGNVLREWLAVKAKMAIFDVLDGIGAKIKQIFGGLNFGGGGGGGFFGSILSGIGKIFGFANGGQPPVNRPSLVGEKGPELFVPKQSGTVIPNDMLGMLGNQKPQQVTNNYITNNINALDSKSVAQVFAENRKTLLGSVRMAQKEMPY